MNKIFAIVALMLAVVMAPLVPGHASERAIAIVVHPSVTETPTRTQLQALFTRRNRHWGDGTPALVFNQEARAPSRVTVDRVLLGMEPDQSARFWIDQRIRYGQESPRSVPEGLICRLVARMRGSIGYCVESQLVDQVRVVGRIIGGRYVQAR